VRNTDGNMKLLVQDNHLRPRLEVRDIGSLMYFGF